MFNIFYINIEKELMLDALFMDRLKLWESKITKSEIYEKLVTYIGFANLRYLGYYDTKDLIDKNKETKAGVMFKTILDNTTFVEQLKDLNITINLFFPSGYIKRKKKVLIRSIISTYHYDKKKRKIAIKTMKNLMKAYEYFWLLFIIKYYKNYMS